MTPFVFSSFSRRAKQWRRCCVVLRINKRGNIVDDDDTNVCRRANAGTTTIRENACVRHRKRGRRLASWMPCTNIPVLACTAGGSPPSRLMNTTADSNNNHQCSEKLSSRRKPLVIDNHTSPSYLDGFLRELVKRRLQKQSTRTSRTVRRHQRPRHFSKGQVGLYLWTNGPANGPEPLLTLPYPQCLAEQTFTSVPTSTPRTLVRPKLVLLLLPLHLQTARPSEGTRLDRLTNVVAVVAQGAHGQLKTPKRWEKARVLAPIKCFCM